MRSPRNADEKSVVVKFSRFHIHGHISFLPSVQGKTAALSLFLCASLFMVSQSMLLPIWGSFAAGYDSHEIENATLILRASSFLRNSTFVLRHFSYRSSMIAEFEKQVSQTLEEIKSQGLFKTERVITTPQDAHIAITGGKRVLNMCANNYLGLADHPALIAAAKEALDTHGFGMASVRFICGTQDIHKELEAALTEFLGTEATILYPSCFDANGGLFETLLTDKDAVISDELNHASII